MKRRTLTALTGIIISFALLATACGGNTLNVSATDAADNVTENAETDAPDGETPDGDMPEGEAPDGKPGDGKGPGGPGGDKPDGKPGDGKGPGGGPGENGGTPPDMPGGGGPGGMGGADTQNYDYEGDLNGALTADGTEVSSSGETISATDSDENTALTINGGTLKIENDTLKKSGDDDNGDNCNFYGLNSIVLAVGEGSTTYISDSALSSDSEGSNAVFATDNATIYINDSTINTSAGNSRGLDATYSGSVIADNVTITTQGEHCASTATDRGGGNITATNSTFETNGSGSPLLYSTGNIQVENVTGVAKGSQIAGMEGLNTITIKDSTLESTITGKTASDPVANGIIIYQSMSGDADTTTGETALFQAEDSVLKSAITEGSMFYITNTTANVVLKNTTLDFDSDKAALLTIEGNDSNNWGTAGENGADVIFTAEGETLKGDISVDTISSLTLNLSDGTTYTGAISIKENSVNTDKTDKPVTVNISSDSAWVVTGDCTISELNAESGANIVDKNGRTVTIIANGKTVVKGDSSITVTVSGSYNS